MGNQDREGVGPGNLAEWRESLRETGKYKWVQGQLREKGVSVSVSWLKAVFLGKEPPGRDLLLALQELTGLAGYDILYPYYAKQNKQGAAKNENQ